MKEEWLFPGAVVPVDIETTAALVVEIRRLIDVVGGMVLAQSKQDCVGWFGYDTGVGAWFETNKGDDDSIPLYKEPPQRTWVGLKDDDEIPWDGVDAKSFARAIEAKLKEKNHG